jgi:hypothetical protein
MEPRETRRASGPPSGGAHSSYRVRLPPRDHRHDSSSPANSGGSRGSTPVTVAASLVAATATCSASSSWTRSAGPARSSHVATAEQVRASISGFIFIPAGAARCSSAFSRCSSSIRWRRRLAPSSRTICSSISPKVNRRTKRFSRSRKDAISRSKWEIASASISMPCAWSNSRRTAAVQTVHAALPAR